MSESAAMEIWVAIGTFVLALATFVLAAITASNVSKTGQLVQATKELGAASGSSADAAKQTIAEIQRDRELEHRPYLSWHLTGWSMSGDELTHPGTVHVANLGRGPALHCLFCACWMNDSGVEPRDLFTTRVLNLAPGQRWTPDDPPETLSRRSRLMPDLEVLGVSGTASGNRQSIAFCQDQLGNYYRFVPHRVAPDTWRDGPKPRWVEFYQGHVVEVDT